MGPFSGISNVTQFDDTFWFWTIEEISYQPYRNLHFSGTLKFFWDLWIFEVFAPSGEFGKIEAFEWPKNPECWNLPKSPENVPKKLIQNTSQIAQEARITLKLVSIGLKYPKAPSILNRKIAEKSLILINSRDFKEGGRWFSDFLCPNIFTARKKIQKVVSKIGFQKIGFLLHLFHNWGLKKVPCWTKNPSNFSFF